MKTNTLKQPSEKIKIRLQQADEMSEVWEKNDEVVQAYLKGCISTATIFANKDKDKEVV